jgi:DNA polymerase-1
MKNSKHVLLVCDGMNILHRGFYATPPMFNKAGEPTNALRGLVQIISADIKDVGATHCAVIFDRPGQNFRHRLYPEYKAHRPKLDGVDMRSMVLPAKKLLNAMGIVVYGKPGIEGDDMIGSLAVRLSKKAMTYIVSNDKDFAALVTDRIHLLKPKKLILDAQGVFDTYGVHPHQMVDYLMMLGDSVDNIPGINKVGPKTASKLLAAHGTLKAICRDAKHTPKMGENFKAAMPFFKVSRKLITLDTSRLHNVKLEDTLIRGPQPNLKAMCDRLEFRSTYTQIINALR